MEADRARRRARRLASNAIAFIKNEIEESAFGYHERYRTEQDVVVGVNRYVEDDAEVEESCASTPRPSAARSSA